VPAEARRGDMDLVAAVEQVLREARAPALRAADLRIEIADHQRNPQSPVGNGRVAVIPY
jgi:hypothetical protein